MEKSEENKYLDTVANDLCRLENFNTIKTKEKKLIQRASSKNYLEKTIPKKIETLIWSNMEGVNTF